MNEVSVRESQVQRELNETQMITEELFKELDMLEDRLALVLHGALNVNPQETTSSAPVLVPLANVIKIRNDALKRAVSKVSSIRSRIEL